MRVYPCLWRSAVPLALALAAWPARAQEPREPREEARAVIVRCEAHEDGCEVQTYGPRRGYLGLLVETARRPETDSVGAYVRDVVHNGPAERAGVRAGDVVIRFNDVGLAARGDSTPGERLLRLARDLEPGEAVRLQIRRDGTTETVTVVAERWRPAFGFGGLLRDFDVEFERLGPREFRFRMPTPPRFDEFRDLPRAFAPFGGRLPGLRLADLNPELGEYFGAREGVLVLDVPEDGLLGLRPGDVILSIDGRRPRDADHARRILGSYDPGERVRIEVLRQKRRQTLEERMRER